MLCTQLIYQNMKTDHTLNKFSVALKELQLVKQKYIWLIGGYDQNRNTGKNCICSQSQNFHLFRCCLETSVGKVELCVND